MIIHDQMSTKANFLTPKLQLIIGQRGRPFESLFFCAIQHCLQQHECEHGINKTSILFLWQIMQFEGSSSSLSLSLLSSELTDSLNRSIDKSSSELAFIILLSMLATFCRNSKGVIVPFLISSVARLIRINRTYE